MSHRSYKSKPIIAVQADNIHSAEQHHQTTLLLCREFWQRSFDIFWYDQADGPIIRNGNVEAYGTMISFSHDKLVIEDKLFLNLGNAAMILVRQNPPTDLAYANKLHILNTLGEKVPVLNRISALLQYPEKFLPLVVAPDVIPETIVANRSYLINDFLSIHKKIVLKPIYDYAANGVIKIEADIEPVELESPFYSKPRRSDPHLAVIEKYLAAAAPLPVIAQRFVPEIMQGDTRIFVAGGEIVAPFRRVPPFGSFITTVSKGATIVETSLSDAEKILATDIARKLSAMGIVFACIDMVGGLVIEINITSPGRLEACNDLYHMKAEAIVVDQLLEAAARD